MGVQRCPGTRDLSPEDMMRFHIIEQAFRESCLGWGYEEVKTPVLEYLHLFTSAGTLTPAMLSRVYSFLDWDGWSGERVVLRPDVTIPVARFYIESLATRPRARLFYVANVFTFEAAGEKTRERWQCGAELIGAGSYLADVELITLALEVLSKLGIGGVELRLSHAGFIKGLLGKLDLSTEEQMKVFDQILEGDTGAFAQVRAIKPEMARVLASWRDLKGGSAGFVRNLRSLLGEDFPDLAPHLDDFVNITDLLERLGYHYRVDMASVRGFEYYTGVICQLFSGEERIGGGGRYDDLIPAMGGKDTPASGFALYLDCLMGLIKLPAAVEEAAGKVAVRVESDEPGILKEGFAVARCLRDTGYIAVLSWDDKAADDYRWRLDVRSGRPRFVLHDRAKRGKSEAQTITEVLALL